MGFLEEMLGSLTMLHPMVIHFPIVYLITAILAESVGIVSGRQGYRQAATILIWLAGISATAAVGAGYLAAEVLRHDSPGHDLVHTHRDIMLAFTTGLLLLGVALAISKGLRLGASRRFLLPILILLAAVMGYGADKGGKMVYLHGVGIKPELLRNSSPPVSMGHHDDHGHGEKQPEVDDHRDDGHSH
ncbi:DUF2231 domain-containing protein [Magnetococcus sp. PR-3]|uniref:DUF2231 domain-containing protein n=1 Tax=Magnetococcus sp. PR-3 TaxID=3120355 RepID=UPI002FCE0255